MSIHRYLCGVLAALCLSGCSLFGVRGDYEQPDYDVAKSIGEDIEIRRYQPRLAVEATVAIDAGDEDTRDAAFRLLFDYITGANAPGVEIAMTTPVETQDQGEDIAMTVPVETAVPSAGKMRMRFFLPQAYDAQTAPKPTHPDVKLVTLPAATVATIRFSGWANDQMVADKAATLMQALALKNWRPAGQPVTLYYDPPWTLPWWRRTEVAIAVIKDE